MDNHTITPIVRIQNDPFPRADDDSTTGEVDAQGFPQDLSRNRGSDQDGSLTRLTQMALTDLVPFSPAVVVDDKATAGPSSNILDLPPKLEVIPPPCFYFGDIGATNMKSNEDVDNKCLKNISYGGKHTEVIVTSVESPGDFWVSSKNGSKMVLHCALYLPQTLSAWSCAATSHFKDVVTASSIVEMVTLMPGDPTVVSLLINGRKIDQEVIGLCSVKVWEAAPVEAFICSQTFNPNDFAIILERDSCLWQSMFEQVTIFSKAADTVLESESVEVGAICSAFYLYAWGRAQVVSHESGGVCVFFIDSGETAVVTELKKLPHHLKKFPGLSVRCALPLPDNSSVWSSAAIYKFQCIAENCDLKCEFLSSKEPFIVNLFSETINVAHNLCTISGINSPSVAQFKAAMKNKVDSVMAALRDSLLTTTS